VVAQAYYGAYHAAVQFEESLPHRSPTTTGNTGSHDALIRCLERPNSKLEYALRIISQELGAQMRMLKPLRELATYQQTEQVGVHEAELTIKAARDVLDECAKARRKIQGTK
jgi:hypothetical protein